MEYTVVKKCMIKGTAYAAGESVVLDTNTARELLRIRRIEPKSEEPVIENRAVGLTEDPVEKPKTRRKKAAVEPEAEAE